MKVNRFLKIFVIILLCSTIHVYALDEIPSNYREETNGTYKMFVDDGANLLTDEQELQLLEDMKNLAEFGNIGFVSTNNCYSSIKKCSKDYYHEKFNKENGSIFYIDMQNRFIGIASEGENQVLITNNKAVLITDNVYQYASSGDYYSCALYAFRDMEKVLNEEKISEPMRYVTNTLLALILGVFFSFFIVTLSSGSNTSKKKIEKKNYNKSLTMANFAAIIVGTKKVYNPPSDSGGYSGGSGWSSGGHSSGGFGGFYGGGGFSGGGFSGGGHSSGSFGGHRF